MDLLFSMRQLGGFNYNDPSHRNHPRRALLTVLSGVQSCSTVRNEHQLSNVTLSCLRAVQSECSTMCTVIVLRQHHNNPRLLAPLDAAGDTECRWCSECRGYQHRVHQEAPVPTRPRVTRDLLTSPRISHRIICHMYVSIPTVAMLSVGLHCGTSQHACQRLYI